MLVASVFLFIVVVFRRKRTEVFLVAIPLLTAVYAVLSIVFQLHMNYWKLFNIPFFQTKAGLNILASSAQYSLALVYWVFAFQYLRTSLILPKLFLD